MAAALAAVVFGCVLLIAAGVGSQADEVNIRWRDAAELTREGQGWPGESQTWRRWPDRAQGVIPDGAWHLGGNTAGMAVRFSSDSTEIRVRWKLSGLFTMDHMPDTGISGVDLYVRDEGKWIWVAVGRPTELENERTLVTGLAPGRREWILYLPLYNGIASLEIGVPEGAGLAPGREHPAGTKPIVVYGTSITQGGCASRPGMAFPAIIGRRLDMPTINLGLSGAGRTEHVVADLLAELDPSVFVIDALPNMGAEPVEERMGYLLKALREKRPETPVILVESYGHRSDLVRTGRLPKDLAVNQNMRKAYLAAKPEWGDLLYYVEGETLLGEDREDTVDGVHATDLGFLRMADALTPVVRKALGM